MAKLPELPIELHVALAHHYGCEVMYLNNWGGSICKTDIQLRCGMVYDLETADNFGMLIVKSYKIREK